ncbi:MAG TPA: isoprenylcysteine carboxylmethyltransferase family protein [Abditibacteriaceae bacterium]|nr:isoprenylcysteine carboxylmethyltransferase family protein [Abditibacteriaceae bacterium]
MLQKPLIEQLKLLLVFVLLAALVYYSNPTPGTFAVGAVLVLIGTLIRVWAAGHLTRDQQLTTSGPYQYTRNPFYLGRFFLIIGFGVMSGLGHWLLWVIFTAALVIFFVYYMPRKEQREGGRLQKLFGEDYERWRANVPSLFPRLTPYRMNPRPWSLRLYLGGADGLRGNKEVWTTIGLIVVVALLYWWKVWQVMPR